MGDPEITPRRAAVGSDLRADLEGRRSQRPGGRRRLPSSDAAAKPVASACVALLTELLRVLTPPAQNNGGLLGVSPDAAQAASDSPLFLQNANHRLKP
jgi:hypothetical protein